MFRWEAPEASADVVLATGLDQLFGSQADAEVWLTSAYEDLVDAGVHAVSLVESDALVYGPMSLHAG